MSAGNVYLVEVEERYSAKVAVRAENEDDAEERVNELINDGGLEPATIVNESAEGSIYSREIISVEKVVRLPKGVVVYE